jgi:hypothetical protein
VARILTTTQQLLQNSTDSIRYGLQPSGAPVFRKEATEQFRKWQQSRLLHVVGPQSLVANRNAIQTRAS